MTLIRKTFDDQPSGTVATPANTGASSVNALNGGTVVFDSGMAARGTACGLKMSATQTSSASDIRFALAPAQKYAFEFVYTTPATLPSVDMAFLDLRTSTRALWLVFRTTGIFQINDATSATHNLTGTFSAGTRYRIAILVDNTGGAGASNLSVNIYSETGTTVLGTYTSSAAQISTGNFIEARFGATTSPAGAIAYGFDDLQWNDGVTTEIGPITGTSSSAPTIVTNDRALYIIDRSGSSSNDSGTLLYSIEQTSGTTTSPTVLSSGIWGVVQSATESLSYTVTITDSLYGSTTSLATVPQQGAATNVSAPLHWDTTKSDWV